MHLLGERYYWHAALACLDLAYFYKSCKALAIPFPAIHGLHGIQVVQTIKKGGLKTRPNLMDS